MREQNEPIWQNSIDRNKDRLSKVTVETKRQPSKSEAEKKEFISRENQTCFKLNY